MAYNPYQAPYQQYTLPFPQMTPTPTVPPQTTTVPSQQGQNSNLIWVQGEAGAKSYLVAPNTTVQLWDSEAQTIYLKSADGSGMPSMKILDYTIRDNNSTETQSHTRILDDPGYATKDEFLSLQEQVEELRRELKTFPRTRSRKKEVEDYDE